jgi:hypothetical protein
MTICPIAIAVGCKKCPVFKIPKASAVKPVAKPAVKPAAKSAAKSAPARKKARK